MAKVVVKKDTAVNRAGAKMRKAGKDATKKGGSDILFTGNKIAINPGSKATKAAGNMTRKARKAK